jgi:predicted O-methyltransferase YrrM
MIRDVVEHGSMLGWMATLKGALPRPLKTSAKEILRRLRFRRYANRAARSPACFADTTFLAGISEAWGNVDYSADTSFLVDTLARVRSDPGGSVLECGSGLSTILMGLAMPPSSGYEIWAFENDFRWVERVGLVTRRHQLRHVRLIHTPLRSYGDYTWYAPPLQCPRFHLVICDGPTEATPGGRYGLLPVMAPHLADDAVVVFDDADTAVGRAVLARWQNEGLGHVELRENSDGVFAIVTVQKPLKP